MKPSNFNFLYARWPNAHYAATKAEQQLFTRSVTAGIYCRQAMELLLNWVYDMDAEYSLPYQNAVGAMHGRPQF